MIVGFSGNLWLWRYAPEYFLVVVECDWIFCSVCCRVCDEFDFPGAGSDQAIRYALPAG